MEGKQVRDEALLQAEYALDEFDNLNDYRTDTIAQAVIERLEKEGFVITKPAS